MIQPGASPIAECCNVDAAAFRDEILPGGEPVVLRGLVKDWPAVQLATPSAFCSYLAGLATEGTVRTLVGPPAIRGRFFYNADLSGLNFDRVEEPLCAALARLLTHLEDSEPPAIAIQAAPVPRHMPDFVLDNPNPLLGPEAVPRLWIGNAASVATHFDPLENLACVAAGRRRFTLFPPEQVGNLYIGPFELTPAGAPVSMVSVQEPDFARYPRFHDALKAARQAVLEPGDALYIPYLWWHHVHALDGFNVLVNYWWNPAGAALGVPFDSVFHGMLAIAALPPRQRYAWRAIFDYYVFRLAGEPAEHLPPASQGMAGPMTPELAARMKAMLRNSISRP